tara:strand:- start:5385 stop:6242 length:858 start_codon:yes stop_codon:yes gene_type:complete
MKILVTGANGQLGYEIKKKSKNYEHDWIFLNRNDCDFKKIDKIDKILSNLNPNVIINCAAYTDVDMAESEYEIADLINHRAVNKIAKWSFVNHCKLIHISTDYVFDGNIDKPINELITPNPLNKYGKTKLLGDMACQKNHPGSIIIRTSWLYSSHGKNFLKKMIYLSKFKDNISVICDEIGKPTYAGDLATVILKLIFEKEWIPGIFNYTNDAEVSWFNFANDIKLIFGFKSEIKKILSKDYKSIAHRPKYSSLDNSKIINVYDINPESYMDSLKKCVMLIKNEL